MTTSLLLEKDAGLYRKFLRGVVKLRKAERRGMGALRSGVGDVGERFTTAMTTHGTADPMDSRVVASVGKSLIDSAKNAIKGTEKTSEDADHASEVRARGQALGSAATHFVTGYAAAPLLYQHKEKPTLTHGKASPSLAEGVRGWAKSVGQRFRSPKRILSGARKYYGTSALKPALTLTGVALAGGYMKERIQAGYEKAHGVNKAAADASEAISAPAEGGGETMRVSRNVTSPDWASVGRRRSRRVVNATVGNAVGGGLAGLVTGAVSRRAGGRGFAAKHLAGAAGVGAFGGAAWGFGTQKYLDHAEKNASAGIYVYQRHPGEVQETKHPGRPRGPAAAFGTRMSPRHALHKLHSEKSEGWMKNNAEFIELGERPGLARSLQTIVGTEGDQVLTRRDAQLMLGERDRIKLLCKEHRHAAKKGKIEHNPNTERDLLEVLEAVETVLQNPKVQALQIVER